MMEQVPVRSHQRNRANEKETPLVEVKVEHVEVKVEQPEAGNPDAEMLSEKSSSNQGSDPNKDTIVKVVTFDVGDECLDADDLTRACSSIIEPIVFDANPDKLAHGRRTNDWYEDRQDCEFMVDLQTQNCS